MNDDPGQAKYIGTDSIDHPDGSRGLPARTCKHLAKVNPNLPDGLYWIDPNSGNIKDAIEVYCHIQSGETCVSPKTVEFKSRAYEAANPGMEHWFHELENNEKVSFFSVKAHF